MTNRKLDQLGEAFEHSERAAVRQASAGRTQPEPDSPKPKATTYLKLWMRRENKLVRKRISEQILGIENAPKSGGSDLPADLLLTWLKLEGNHAVICSN